MKKETYIVIFYILYFAWLFSLVYLTPRETLLNWFATGIIFFYFTFLKEDGDLVWFAATFLGTIMGKISSVERGHLLFNTEVISSIPIWLPIAWGTTIVALRKFFVMLNVGKN
jgi:hypothetical protein